MQFSPTLICISTDACDIFVIGPACGYAAAVQPVSGPQKFGQWHYTAEGSRNPDLQLVHLTRSWIRPSISCHACTRQAHFLTHTHLSCFVQSQARHFVVGNPLGVLRWRCATKADGLMPLSSTRLFRGAFSGCAGASSQTVFLYSLAPRCPRSKLVG